VEVGRPEGLLSKLSADDWAKISLDIDYVSYIFDDPLFLTDEWVSSAELLLKNPAAPHAARVQAGVGIALFPCGCLIPNAYFKRVSHRLDGFECILLPGWVLAHEDVHWLDVRDKSAESCKRREAMLASRRTAQYRKELADIHKVLEGVKSEVDAKELPAPHEEETEKSTGSSVSALVKGALDQVRSPQIASSSKR